MEDLLWRWILVLLLCSIASADPKAKPDPIAEADPRAVAEPEADPDPSLVIKQYIVKHISHFKPKTCSKDSECTDEERCIDEKCQCPSDIQSVVAHKCLSGKYLGQSCSVNEQCQTSHSECYLLECTCLPSYRNDGNTCVKMKALNESCSDCEEGTGCADPNSGCLQGFCKCHHGYEEMDGRCATAIVPEGELLGHCGSGAQPCVTTNSECDGGLCRCDDLHLQVWGQCLEEKNVGESCSYTKQCPSNSFCNCSNVCVCNEEYVVITSGSACQPVRTRGGSCEYTEQCSGTHVGCISNVCSCDVNFGPKLNSTVDCVAETTSVSYGPFAVPSATLPYKTEYSDLSSTEYNTEMKPYLETSVIPFYDAALKNNGLDVKSIDVLSVTGNTDGGSDVTFLVTVYNPELDRNAKKRSVLNGQEKEVRLLLDAVLRRLYGQDQVIRDAMNAELLQVETETKSLEVGPIIVPKETFPYKPEYSDLSSPEYITELKPFLDAHVIASYDTALKNNGVEVKSIDVLSVAENENGGADIKLLIIVYSSKLDSDGTLKRYVNKQQTDALTSLEEIRNKIDTILRNVNRHKQTIRGIKTSTYMQVKTASRLHEMCDYDSDCNVMSVECRDGACECKDGAEDSCFNL